MIRRLDAEESNNALSLVMCHRMNGIALDRSEQKMTGRLLFRQI